MNIPEIGLPPDLVIHEGPSVMSDETWHYPRTIFRDVRKRTTGRGSKVAVLDTGYYKHPTLPKAIAERSFINGESVDDPVSGHGTHCCGTILSRDEDIGAAPEAELIVGKVLSNRGSGSSTGIAAGVEWAIEQGADVISMSLGGPSRYEPTITAIKRAFSKGVVVCIAAGNSGFSGSGNTIGYPARSGEGICVAALKRDYTPANFSSGGVQMTVAAPGQDILSCNNNGSGFRWMSGTSMATPWTAGVIALIISLMRSQGRPSMLGKDAWHEFIKLNAKDLLSPGHDPATGHGMFDMLDLVQRLAHDDLKFA